MNREKKDFSENCDLNDENVSNDCWSCQYFLFPIGCMYGEEELDEFIRKENKDNG